MPGGPPSLAPSTAARLQLRGMLLGSHACVVGGSVAAAAGSVTDSACVVAGSACVVAVTRRERQHEATPSVRSSAATAAHCVASGPEGIAGRVTISIKLKRTRRDYQ